MHSATLLFITFSHSSLAILTSPYPKQTFQLPKHPLSWICTVHVTAATFKDYTSSDITERFLTSNHEKIISTLSTMLNSSITTAPVISFFEPCTISVLVDAPSNVSSEIGLARYIDSNEYIYRGWRYSVIIYIYFSCVPARHFNSLRLPFRLFYHSLDCGPQNTFPNQVFIADPLQALLTISDPTHNIHFRELPLSMKKIDPETNLQLERT
jgi:hypothetical protein